MKKLLFILLIASLVDIKIVAQTTDSQKTEWFQEAKFGLFLHWGLYSQTAGEWKGHPTNGGEHFMLYERIPLKEYALICKDFNPVRFNASEWAKTAKYAGMKYVVITAKHHDGFSMYDSQCSNYNIVKCTPYAKDPMKELVAACRKEGLKFGFYYSLGRDWEDPDVPTNWPTKAGRSNSWDYPNEDAKDLSAYIERKVKPQLRELLTNYGPIDIIWFDTPELTTKQQSQEIRDLILSIQPKCLINNRIGNGLGDYSIMEQQLNNSINLKPWEACITMGKNWGYNRYDTIYKKPDIMIRHLADIVSKGGNLLLNIGPDGKGNFPSQTQPILAIFHQWLKKNGESIYKTSPWRIFGENLESETIKEEKEIAFHDAVFDATPKDCVPDFRYTCKGNHVYIIARHVSATTFTLHSFHKTDRIKEITCLSEKKEIKWKLTEQGLTINLSTPIGSYPVYVLKVLMDKNIKDKPNN